ncbi:MAG: hypothetical protein QOF14_1918 [Hyphomicrobiales bacterium]|jgi:hypothetical protein|nr:hypothetical protein [Hyphomicrobiales bacterium]
MGDDPEQGADGLRDHDKQQGDLQNPKEVGRELPAGLKRERKGPLGPEHGRRER